jgi:hypothetical protein
MYFGLFRYSTVLSVCIKQLVKQRMKALAIMQDGNLLHV